MTTATLPKATKRNSRTINGQLWHFRADSYRKYDTLGNTTERAIIATRYSDMRTVTGSSRDSLEVVIAERIADGSY